tara:strand:- start:1899 stop:2258 length:360 start_codon:yes stop_codon:yes gene_type:complete
MPEETKPTPRVLRRSASTTPAVVVEDTDTEVFSDTLSNGRLVAFREITAGDLLYLEKALGNLGEMERSLKLASRISVGEGRITYEDLQKLKMRDIKVITALLSQAGDAGDDDEDEFPNE